MVRTIVALVPGADAVPIEYGAVPSPVDDPPLLVADVRRLGGEVGLCPRIELHDGLSGVWQRFGTNRAIGRRHPSLRP
jgi:hypothetical protein